MMQCIIYNFLCNNIFFVISELSLNLEYILICDAVPMKSIVRRYIWINPHSKFPQFKSSPILYNNRVCCWLRNNALSHMYSEDKFFPGDCLGPTDSSCTWFACTVLNLTRRLNSLEDIPLSFLLSVSKCMIILDIDVFCKLKM